MQQTAPESAGAAPAVAGRGAAADERAPAPAACREPLFDAGGPLLDDDVARANWAVPWSDLMMTMFVLFAVLLAAQTVRQRTQEAARTPIAAEGPERKVPQVEERIVERQQPVPDPVEKPVEAPGREQALPLRPGEDPPVRINVLERSREAVREANLENAEIVLMDDQSVKVSVQGPMFFATGKADLRPEVTHFLDRLALVIKQTPYEIHVVGHTDDVPINTPMFPSNWELSLIRASHVARYLIKSGTLAPSRFVVMGRGEYEPAAENAGARERALNRRVEIVITRTVTESEKAKRR